MRTAILIGGLRSSALAFVFWLLAENGDLVALFVLRRLDFKSDSAWSKKRKPIMFLLESHEGHSLLMMGKSYWLCYWLPNVVKFVIDAQYCQDTPPLQS